MRVSRCCVICGTINHMHPILYILIGFIVGVVVGRSFESKKIKGIGKITQERTGAKQENKDKIVAYLKERNSARNNDIEKLLGVSDTTATRYFDELQKQGIVEQIGDVGRGVEYKLK